MPVLAGIRAADVFAVLLQVREDVDLGIFLAQVALPRGWPLDLAKPLGETFQIAKVETLVGKAQHAMPSEREQDHAHLPLAQRL